MSQLKVDAIRNTSASSDAITLASDGTCTAKITNNLSNRRLTINGDMKIAQRGTSETNTTGMYTVDRYSVGAGGHDESPDQAQHALTSSDTGPWAKGFRYSWLITNGNQSSGAGSGDYIDIQHRIEAQDMSQSGWNYTSASSYVTLSFWVKSSVAQNFYGYLRSRDGTNQRYGFETGSLSADTWTKITKTIPGNSNIQFDNDNGEGLRIAFLAFLGGDYTASGTNLNTWEAYSSSTITPDNTSTWYTTNNATLEFTGIQLEVGDYPSSYEFRTYADELRKCMRYCQVTDGGGNGTGVVGGSTQGDRIQMDLKEIMRANPTITKVGNNIYMHDGSTQVQVSTTAAEYGTPHSIEWEFTSCASGSGLTTGNALVSYINGSSGGFKMDAEL